MDGPKWIAVGFWAVMTTLFAVSILRRWAAFEFDRVGPNAVRWLWLRVLGVPRTKRNCVRFANVASMLGIILLTVSLVVILVFGR
jgi:hypothetical protein